MTEQSDPPGVALVKRTGQEIITALQTDGLAGIQRQGIKRTERERHLKTCAALVFAYWAAKYCHPRAYLDEEREKKIVARLRENDGDVSELMYTIDGGLKDDWVNGTARNARHKNDGILYIFASRERVEQFAELCPGYQGSRPHKMALKYLAPHLNGNGNGNGIATSAANGRGDRADSHAAAGECD